MIPPFLRRCFLWSGLWLLILVGPAPADIKLPETLRRPPIARAAQARAVRGVPVEIPLAGLTASPKVLQFFIRQQPKHGRLEGPPVQAGKDSAVVRYIPDLQSTAEADTFTFAVKVEGSGSSQEAMVTVRLEDPAPVLEAPGGLDLGRVLAAEAVDRTLVIANRGNAPWEATVPVPEGWSWLVPIGGKFRINPGEQIEAVLRVRPEKEGELDQTINLRPDTPVRVIGRVVPPFLGYPSLIRLQWTQGTEVRAWSFRIRNNQAEPLTVGLSAPDNLEIPETLTIPGAESAEVRVACTGNPGTPLEGQIRLTSPNWRQEIRFDAPAAPAWVVVSGTTAEDTVDFGTMEVAAGSHSAKTLSLRNAGGSPATIRWDPLRFFLLEGMDPEFVLAPQSEKSFSLRPRPDEPGRLKEDLNLRMTGGDRTLRLLADIDPAAAKAAMMSGTVLNTTPVQSSQAESGNNGRRVTEQGRRLRVQLLGPGGGLMESIGKKDPSLPAVSVVRYNEKESKPDKLVFEWDAPAPGNWTYRVLVRMLRYHAPGQAPIPEYDQMDNVKVTPTATGGRAEVTKLRPEVFWKCRIVAIRSDGVSTTPSEELTFMTPPVPDSRWGWRLMGGIGIFAVVLYVRQKWREDVKWKD